MMIADNLRPLKNHFSTVEIPRRGICPDEGLPTEMSLRKFCNSLNLEIVREKIAVAAKKSGRGIEDIKLVCVTKEADLAQIKQVIAGGVTDLGENRVQSAKEKKRALDNPGIFWHMIGHLQTNKAGLALEIFDLIHSVDSVKLARVLNQQAREKNRHVEVLLQVNVSKEPSKYGFFAEELGQAIDEILKLQNLKVSGLMTIAPFSANPENSRPYFSRLRELRDGLGIEKIRHLSMGMSTDFPVAIEEGADIIRLGRAIFGN